MTKKKLSIYLLISFLCGGYLGGELFGYISSRAGIRLAIETSANQVVFALRTLDELKRGNNAEAIKIMEKQLNDSIPYLEKKVNELPPEKRDPYHIKILSMNSEYRSRNPVKQETPSPNN